MFGIIVVAALVHGHLCRSQSSPRSETSVNAFISSYRDRLQEARRAPDAPPHVYPALPPAAAPAARPPPRRRRPRPRPAPAPAAEACPVTFDASQLLAYAPLLILIGDGLPSCCSPRPSCAGQSRAGLAWLGVAGCVAALVAVVDPVARRGRRRSRTSIRMLVVDRMALYLDGAFIVAALLTLLFAPPYLREHGFEFGEFYALVLFATAGMVMVAHATHLVSLLIGIETMSLAAYVLTGCWRKSLRSSEGAMKYFLMGAFATGFLVYGIALVYGTTGGEMSLRGHRRQGRNAAGQGAAVLPRRVLHPGRAGVQGRGGAVPHVGARCLRGRAHAGHRLHGGGREGGGVRRHRARAGQRVRQPGAGLRRHRLGERAQRSARRSP